MAAAYGVHPNQVAQWRDAVLKGMVGLFAGSKESEWAAKEATYEAEKQELYAEIGRLTTQLSWLGENLANSLSRAEPLALLDWEGQEIAVQLQCELLNLNRSDV